MRRKIDRRHFRKTDGTSACAIAGFNLALGADQQKLPRSIRRVLAGVRRPLRAEERRAAFEHGLVLIETRPSSGHPGRTYHPRASLRAGGSR